MSGLGIRPEGKTMRSPAGGCAVAVTSKPWGTMTAETRTQARSRLPRSLHGERAISRPPSRPSQSSPPSSKSLVYSVVSRSPCRYTLSLPVCFCSSSRVFKHACSVLLGFGWFYSAREWTGECISVSFCKGTLPPVL